MYMQIENIKVCNPITTLIQYLENKGFRIVEFKITDYHFHEVYIKMSGERTDDIETINITNIQRYSDRTFVCSCHWSTIELVYDKDTCQSP